MEKEQMGLQDKLLTIRNLIKDMSKEELEKVAIDVRSEIDRKTEKYYVCELTHNPYKGVKDGKNGWVARVDERGKIEEFMRPVDTEKANYIKYRTFYLKDGRYKSCDVGTGSYNVYSYFTVIDGKRHKGLWTDKEIQEYREEIRQKQQQDNTLDKEKGETQNQERIDEKIETNETEKAEDKRDKIQETENVKAGTGKDDIEMEM